MKNWYFLLVNNKVFYKKRIFQILLISSCIYNLTRNANLKNVSFVIQRYNIMAYFVKVWKNWFPKIVLECKHNLHAAKICCHNSWVSCANMSCQRILFSQTSDLALDTSCYKRLSKEMLAHIGCCESACAKNKVLLYFYLLL